MKKKDVPQQGGLNAGCREINYAVDEQGHYTLESSVGWEAKNIALRQAWEEIIDQLNDVLEEIRSGAKSPLAYHMVKNQMDPALLARYSGIARWRVKRHLKPAVFTRLGPDDLTPYAELFGISVETLQQIPEAPDLSLDELNPPGGISG
ncbi:MAG: hypothetical protein C0623_03170 [Desulfuromonas sp.]|nr:MAG: hypothetical protein C0623_03170 [Desulfuromonas sp.]